MNSIQHNPTVDRPATYQIRVQGMIDESWSDWFDGMAVTFDGDSDRGVITALTGEVIDQAALHGVLNRIRDLNIPLISVQLVSPETEFGEDIT